MDMSQLSTLQDKAVAQHAHDLGMHDPGRDDPGANGSNPPDDVKVKSWVIAAGKMRSPSPISRTS